MNLGRIVVDYLWDGLGCGAVCLRACHVAHELPIRRYVILGGLGYNLGLDDGVHHHLPRFGSKLPNNWEVWAHRCIVNCGDLPY